MRRDELRIREPGVGDADDNELGNLHAATPQRVGELRRGGEIGRITPVLQPRRPPTDTLVAVLAEIRADERRAQVPGEIPKLHAIDRATERQQQRVRTTTRITHEVLLHPDHTRLPGSCHVLGASRSRGCKNNGYEHRDPRESSHLRPTVPTACHPPSRTDTCSHTPTALPTRVGSAAGTLATSASQTCAATGAFGQIRSR